MIKMLAIILAAMSFNLAQAQKTGDSARADTSLLSAVVVKGKKPLIQLLPDKTIINVEASLTNSGATLVEVLEKSPGIIFEKNGNISLKGRQGVLILIDGKATQLSGADLNNLLTGMMASEVETIEIMDNPPAKFDAAGNAGIINIKTKKNHQRGFNGNLNITAGQGRYSRTNNSVTINYFAGKLNVFTTIGINANKNFSKLYAFRKYYEADEKTVTAMLEQPSFFKGSVPSQSLKVGADYFVSSKTTIGTVVRLTNYYKRSTGINTASWMDAAGNPDSTIVTTTNNRDKQQSLALNLNAKQRLSATDDITVDFDHLQYRLRNNQQFSNQLKFPDSYLENITGNIPATIHIFTGKADYTHQSDYGWKFEAGWKSSHIKTNNKADYSYSFNGGAFEPDYNKSNHFLYEENIHAVYAAARKNIDKWELNGGLRYEYTSYDAHQLGNPQRKDSAFSRKYSGLFPNITLSYPVDSNNNFSLTAGRRIDRPPFRSLNPFVFVINKYTYESGNPFYRPQYTWNTEFTYSYKNTFTASLNYSFTDDYFSQIFFVDSAGIITYTEGNLDRMKNYGLSFNAQWPLTNWWNISGQANVNYKDIRGYVWTNLTASLTQFNFNINNQFSFDKGWGAEIAGFLQLREQELQEITDPTGQLIVGVSKQLFNNRVSLKLLVRDVFYTQAMKGNTIFKQATEYFKITRDSRFATFSFSYRFGKTAKSTPRRVPGGAEDEMRRVNSPG